MTDLWKGPEFVEVDAGENHINIASIARSISFGQSMKAWRRGRKMNHYIILLWLEWTSSCPMSAVTWYYLRNYVPGGFPVFFTLIFFWYIQLQALIQIIINRITILIAWVNINKVWDRIEKIIFLLVDAGLNLYFIYLTRLFRFNLGMIFCRQRPPCNESKPAFLLPSLSVSMQHVDFGLAKGGQTICVNLYLSARGTTSSGVMVSQGR
ncbi:hypothetical protein DER45DRAFT_588437 [Fusarium avenaceum]|nr:hypothetical protein DER45DRAFT_588437 [Fusarium avenaceum]